jgi:V/A-type H+-transporting ATPase subunit C
MDTKINKYIINRFKQTKVPYKCEDGKQKFVKTLIDLDIIKNILRGKQLGYDEKELKKLFIGEGREIALWKFNELTELETVSNVITNLEGTSYYDALKNNIEKYNQEKSVQVFETVLDETLLKIVREISTQNYTTIGPSIRFLVSKEFEIKNLKIIAKGVGENLSSDIIKSYLTMEVS